MKTVLNQTHVSYVAVGLISSCKKITVEMEIQFKLLKYYIYILEH